MNPTRPTPIRLTSLFVSAALLFCFSAAPAFADKDGDGPNYKNYFEFSAGVSFIPNQTVKAGSLMGRIEPHTDAKRRGFNIGGAFGRQITDLFRAEFAVSYRESGIDAVSLGGAGVNADGNIALLAVMLNGYVDLSPEVIGVDLGVIPYVGFGIGYGELQVDIRETATNAFDLDGLESVFVYNAMVGGRIPITDVVELSLGYRYIATTQTDEARVTILGITQNLEAEFDAHEVSAGMRFLF